MAVLQSRLAASTSAAQANQNAALLAALRKQFQPALRDPNTKKYISPANYAKLYVNQNILNPKPANQNRRPRATRSSGVGQATPVNQNIPLNAPVEQLLRLQLDFMQERAKVEDKRWSEQERWMKKAALNSNQQGGGGMLAGVGKGVKNFAKRLGLAGLLGALGYLAYDNWDDIKGKTGLGNTKMGDMGDFFSSGAGTGALAGLIAGKRQGGVVGAGTSLYNLYTRRNDGESLTGQRPGESGLLNSRLSNYASAAVSGAYAGSVGGPWGALIGGIVGLGSAVYADNFEVINKKVTEFATKFEEGVKGQVQEATEIIQEAYKTVKGAYNKTVKAFEDTGKYLKDSWTAVAGFTANLWEQIKNGGLSGVGKFLYNIYSGNWKEVLATITGSFKKATGAGAEAVEQSHKDELQTRLDNYRRDKEGGSATGYTTRETQETKPQVGMTSTGGVDPYWRKITNDAAARTGIDPAFLMATANAESAMGKNTVNPYSNARGAYQFMPKTWAGIVANYGDKYGISMQDIDDPAKQALAAALLAQEGKGVLKTVGRTGTAGELYAHHVLGASNTKQFYNSMAVDPNTLAKDVLSKKVIEDNPGIFIDRARGGARNRTLAEVQAIFDKKVEGASAGYAEAFNPEPRMMSQKNWMGVWKNYGQPRSSTAIEAMRGNEDKVINEVSPSLLKAPAGPGVPGEAEVAPKRQSSIPMSVDPPRLSNVPLTHMEDTAGIMLINSGILA
jgi:hypothetical protein